ncbi:MAG: type II toxin-antitoxin system VapC family toxin [Salinivirgaceae bacterium]|nr:type II toxin-antitoxin system VapC family toxin [Salinivirgaceae bacterium]
MKYLIDTHILIWLAISPQEISKDALRTLENPENKVFVSTISLWEIAIKLSIGKLDLQGLKISDLVQFCDEQNIRIIQLPLSAVEQYQRLPKKENHKDPFDRLLISLSIADNYTFVSADGKVDLYREDGLVYIG